MPRGRLYGMRQLAFSRAAAFLLALTLSAAAPARGASYPFPGFDLTRAVANYEALMRGTRQPGNLSAIELREVREIQRQIGAQHVDPGTSREQCIVEQTRARGGKLSDLAARIVDLACSQR
jgi:hypothetical protein